MYVKAIQRSLPVSNNRLSSFSQIMLSNRTSDTVINDLSHVLLASINLSPLHLLLCIGGKTSNSHSSKSLSLARFHTRISNHCPLKEFESFRPVIFYQEISGRSSYISSKDVQMNPFRCPILYHRVP